MDMAPLEEIIKNRLTNVKDTEITDLDIGNKIDILQSKLKLLSEFPEAYDRVVIKIYLTCPNAYEMLQKSLKLPPVTELRKIFNTNRISTDWDNGEDNTVFASALRQKARNMNDKQKICVSCVATIDVKKNLYYDIKRDKLIGVHEIREQKPELAQKVIVISLQGLFSDWRQLVAIGYLSSTCDVADTKKWVVKNMTNLLKMGYDIKALVKDAEDKDIAFTDCNEIDSNKVYILNDINSMVKWFYITWFTHNYIFNDKVANIQHLYDYYERDRKNIVRLSPNLTEKVLKPESKEDLSIADILEVFSMQTAAAMTAYVTLGALNPAAKNTVLFITALSELLKALYTSECVNASHAKTFKLVDEIMTFFSVAKVVTRSGTILTNESTLVPAFCSTIGKIMKLRSRRDIKKYESDSKKFFQRLSLQSLESFFKRFKKDNSLPTCKKLHYCFIETSLNTILKPIAGKKTVDLNDFLDEMVSIIVDRSHYYKYKRVNVPIKSSEYNTLNLKRDDAIVMVTGYLQKRCFDRHVGCEQFNCYCHVVSQPSDSILLCQTILKEIHANICAVPQENFIELVEMMEIKFRSFMTKETLKTQNGLMEGLLKAIDPIAFYMPCKCFPLYYAKMLYLRLRIWNLLTFNNRHFAEFPENPKNHIVVNDLFE